MVGCDMSSTRWRPSRMRYLASWPFPKDVGNAILNLRRLRRPTSRDPVGVHPVNPGCLKPSEERPMTSDSVIAHFSHTSCFPCGDRPSTSRLLRLPPTPRMILGDAWRWL